MCFGGHSAPQAAPAQVVKPTFVHNPYLDSFGDPAAGAKDNPNVTNRASLEIPIGFTGRGGSGEASGTQGGAGTGLGIVRKAQSSGLAIRPSPDAPGYIVPGGADPGHLTTQVPGAPPPDPNNPFPVPTFHWHP